MKKTRFLLLIGLLLLQLFQSKAEEVTIDGIIYSYDTEGDASVVRCDDGKTEAIVQEIVNGHNVTSICKEAFYCCTKLTTVQLPESITNIDKYAFEYCWALKSIKIPDNVTNIRESAFEWCSSLEEVILPRNLKRIENLAFSQCEGLKTITIPSGVEFIAENAFARNQIQYCEKTLLYVNIVGDNVPNYDVYKNLINMNVLKDQAIIFIDSGMYGEYSKIPEWSRCQYWIIAADMLEQKTVELTADENQSALFETLGDSSEFVANLKIEGSINGYDIMALSNKLSRLLYLDLTDAHIVANDGGYQYRSGCWLKENDELGNMCFAETNLINVKLPKSLKYIGYSAFSECIFLKQITIPSTVVSIGSGAFYNCNQLESTIIIPDGVESIQGNTFYGCIKLDSVYIGNKVTTIDDYGFSGCSNIRFISFNRQLVEIGNYTFSGCSNLRSASLPYTVERIGNNAFYECDSLKSIKIPSMTKTIGDHAFYGCDDIENIYTYTVEPTSIDQNTFTCFTSAILNVPKASVDLYQYDTKWSQFETLREFDEPYDAFYLNGDLCLDDNTGRLGGEPDAQMYATSGIVVEGEQVQELKDVELTHDGKDGGTIIGAANDVTGSQVNLTAQSLKVNISVDGGRWYFFCFPFDVVHDSIECTAGYVFYNYDGSKRANDNSGWTKLSSDFEQLQKGVGYIFQADRTGILTIHVGSEYLTFTAGREREALNEYASADATNAGWNMIGNPFISYYDVQDLAQEYDAPIVIWNGYGYDAYKPGDDDYQLKPFEAFFVQKEAGSSYVEFLPENRLTYNQAATRSTLRAARRAQMGTPVDLDRQLVNIVLMGQDSVTDRTRIVYSVNASMDYEIGVDAAKFQADGVPQLYTLNGKTKYAINERPMGTDEIKLGYTAPKAGTYTLSVPRHDAEVEIYDNVAKSKVDFTFGDYQFTSKAGTYNDRFVIHKTSGGVTAVDNGFRLDGMTVTSYDGYLQVSGLKGKVIEVFEPSGIKVETISTDGSYNYKAGIYMIKVGDYSVKTVVL